MTLSNGRFGWMDSLRGMSILLVVFGHAVQLAAMYTGHEFTRLDWFIGTIGPLRMPLLFFLSGMLVPQSIAKGAVKYFRGKVDKILYPYFLWSLVIIAASYFLSLKLSWWEVPPVWDIVGSPVQHLWFLAYLLVFYSVAYAARHVNALWVMAAATLLMGLEFSGVWGRLAELAVPFFLGVAVVRYRESFDRITGHVWASAGLLAVAVLVSIGDRAGVLNLPSFSWAIPVLLAFFVGIIGIMKPIGDHTLFAPIRYVGEKSIMVYILHWPIMMIVIPLLVTDGYREPWGLFFIALACGLIPPTLVAAMTSRVHAARWLFAWNPQRPKASDLAPWKSTPARTENPTLKAR